MRKYGVGVMRDFAVGGATFIRVFLDTDHHGYRLFLSWRSGRRKEMSADWTPERVAALIALWNEGHSTSEIGRRLGITKNAVIGKVHRLGLPKRRLSPATEPEIAQVIKLDSLRSGMCSWPLGNPGEEGFHFCGAPAVPEKPYCAKHCSIAYVKITRDRSRTTAA
jgi:GcrA cell cycle regulator